MQLIDESIRFEIEVRDSKSTRREIFLEFLLPLKDELQEKIKGYSFFFEPELQLDIRAEVDNHDNIKKTVESYIEKSSDLENHEFVPQPSRAEQGDTKKDKEALIRGHELGAELALSLYKIKLKADAGKDPDWHSCRRVHLVLNQMGWCEDEWKCYLVQMVPRHPNINQNNPEEVKQIQREIVDILKQ